MTTETPEAEAPAVAGRNEAFVDDDAAPVPIEFGLCPCPGDPKPHPNGDTIFLAPELDLKGGFTFASAFTSGSTDEAGYPLDQVLGMAYLAAGITDWTFLDSLGRRIPPSRANIAKLKWSPAVAEIAEAAALRYGVSALLPLVARARKSSPRGRTPRARSTSAKSGCSSPRRKR